MSAVAQNLTLVFSLNSIKFYSLNICFNLLPFLFVPINFHLT